MTDDFAMWENEIESEHDCGHDGTVVYRRGGSHYCPCGAMWQPDGTRIERADR